MFLAALLTIFPKCEKQTPINTRMDSQTVGHSYNENITH